MNITFKALVLAAALAPAAAWAQATPGEGDQTPPQTEPGLTAPVGPGDTGTGPSTTPGTTPTPGAETSTIGAPRVSTTTAPTAPVDDGTRSWDKVPDWRPGDETPPQVR